MLLGKVSKPSTLSSLNTTYNAHAKPARMPAAGIRNLRTSPSINAMTLRMGPNSVCRGTMYSKAYMWSGVEWSGVRQLRTRVRELVKENMMRNIEEKEKKSGRVD